MNLRSLEYFLVVAEEMNFTRAAERLFITQQALSSHIQRLEAEYDAELFHRKPVLALTQKGEELRYWAQQILSAEKALRANLHDISINCRGRIRIGIARLRANAMMPDIMERYRKTYPNVTIELLHGSTDQLQSMLLENKVDMYVGVNVETGLNEVQVPLVEEDIWGCTSQSFFREQFYEDEEMQHFLSSERDIRTISGLPLLVTLPSNMFTSVTLPATLWFFDKHKPQTDKRDQILFVDARNVFTQVDRAHRKFSDEQIKNLGVITRLYEGDTAAFAALIEEYRAALAQAPETAPDKETKPKAYWQQQIDWLTERFPEGVYRDVIGLCKVARVGVTLDEQGNEIIEEDSIADQDYSLNAGRYVGVVIEDDGMTAEEFKATMQGLHGEFLSLNEEARKLEEQIAENFKGLFC